MSARGDGGDDPRATGVWHLSSNRWNSAITEYALSAARSLAMRAYPTVFTPLAGSPAEKRAVAAGLATRPAASFGFLARGALAAMAKEIAPRVVVTYGGPETSLARLLPYPRAPLFVRFRGQALEVSGVVGAWRYRLGHRHVGLVLTPSEALARATAALDGDRPAVCVPLGCDANRYQRVEALDPRERPEVVLLGRLDPVKGHEVAFAMLRDVLASWPHTAPKPLLHVVGEPANLSVDDVVAMGKRAGLAPDVDFRVTARRVDDLPALLSRAAIGIVPSTGSEIIGRVTEEFLLCGTPVVLSGVGSLEEALFPGGGASYRGMNPADRARLLLGWIRRSVEEGEAAKESRAATARRLYSYETMGESLDAVLRARLVPERREGSR
jgi:glycosyltransferase involved in cell wall biosynthesis